MTLDDKFYIQNDDKQNYPSCRLKLLVERFLHYWFETNQS